MIKPFSPGKPLILGALSGGLTSLAVMALNAAGAQAAGFAFIPFLYFDWLVRALPGWIVVPGLEAMLRLVGRFALGPTDVVAKLAENGLALVVFIGFGAASGALIGLLGEFYPRLRWPVGPAWGLASFGVTLAIEASGPLPPGIALAGDAAGQALLLLGWGSLMGFLAVAVPRAWVKNPAGGEKARAVEVDTGRRRMLGWLASVGLAAYLAWAGLSAAVKRPGHTPEPSPAPIRPSATLAPRLTVTPAPPEAVTPVAPTLADTEPDTPAARAPGGGTGADGRILPAPGTRQELTTQAAFYRVDRPVCLAAGVGWAGRQAPIHQPG